MTIFPREPSREDRLPARSSRRSPSRVPGTNTKGKTSKGKKAPAKGDPVGVQLGRLSDWVAAEPLTRGPAVALVMLYVAGAFSTDSDPTVWAVLGGCAAVVGYMVGKRSGGEQWGRTLAGIAVASGSWLAACAIVGTVASKPMFLSYVVGGTAAWAWWFQSDRVSKRRAWRVTQANWKPYAEDVGLEGSRLHSVRETRLGFTLRVDVRGTGKVPEELIGKKLRARIAGKHGIPTGRVATVPDDRHGGMIYITVRLIDPWANAIPHPLCDPEVDPQEWRADRTIDMPIQIGLDPETDEPLCLEIYNAAGGQHVVIVAGSRGGKTTLLNSVIEHLTDCDDVVLRIIDVSKAKDARAWAPLCAEVAMGPEAVPQALAMLRAAKARVVARAAQSMTAVHRPTPAEPANVTIIDEASELLGRKDAWGTEARELINFLSGKGLSEAEILLIAAQRGVLGHLGTGDVKANSLVRVLLGVASKGEMQWVIPDWEERGMPDMSKYGEGRKGVALVAPAGERWASGRCFDLSELPAIRAIVAARMAERPGRTAPAAPVAAPAGPAPAATRDRLAFEPPADGVDGPDVAEAVPAVPAPRPPGAAVAQAGGGPADPDDPDSVPGAPWATPGPATPAAGQLIPGPWLGGLGHPLAEASAGATPAAPRPGHPGHPPAGPVAEATQAWATAEAALRELAAQGPDAAATPWAMREAATAERDQRRVIPDAVLLPTLELLTERGLDGATREQIGERLGLRKVQAADWCRVMTNQGRITRHGSGPQTFYTIPMEIREEM